jgi:hypothetical protein
MRSKLSDAMKNNVPLFKNTFGIISINKLAESIKKGEMISHESVIHLAFAIWQQRTFILIGCRSSQLIYMEFTPIATSDNNDDNFAFYAAICEDGYYGLTK